MSPNRSPIKRLLIANRGEIAFRIISSALELGIHPIALYTQEDSTHARFASEAIQLPDASSYMDAELIVKLCKEHSIDAVHPGYGFLSESAEFARLAGDAGVNVVGPGAELLGRTGDKIRARDLARSCGVAVLPALEMPTRDVATIRSFAAKIGYPIMIKAVDGGGGRGIRLVKSEGDLESAVARAVEESPSRLVFAERAAVEGFLHVEVQIVGDGMGGVVHLLERQCSIQRRYQKVVEIAPCVGVERRFVARIIEAAVGIAQRVKYLSLGTFEFLANPRTKEFYFLEINPRLQVEHTLTETILDIDLVRSQLLIAQGATLADVELPRIPPNPLSQPSKYACQLRITAEDVSRNWTLSVGKISSITFPGGNGIRLDQAITPGQVVGSSFDSLLAKIIVSGRTWPEVVRKAQRALHETVIEGVKTNLPALRGILAHPDFARGDCDTSWLETHQDEIIRLGSQPTKYATLPSVKSASAQQTAITAIATGPPLFRRGDAWTVDLAPVDGPENESKTSHLTLARILRNDFPSSFVSEVEFTTPNGETVEYRMTLNSTTSSAAAVTSDHRRGDARNPRHIVIPFPGKLVEVMVDEGDIVRAEDVICVVQQMKMEIEIRAKRTGRVVWVTDIEDGEEVTEGILAAEIEPLDESESAKL